MSPKSLILLCMTIGSTIGGFIPNLWGASFLSLWSVIFTAIGGIAGIWFGYKIK